MTQTIINIVVSVLLAMNGSFLTIAVTQQWNRDSIQDQRITDVKEDSTKKDIEILNLINSIKNDIINTLNSTKSELTFAQEGLRSQLISTQMEQSRRGTIINSMGEASTAIPKMSERIVALEIAMKQLSNSFDKLELTVNNFVAKKVHP